MVLGTNGLARGAPFLTERKTVEVLSRCSRFPGPASFCVLSVIACHGPGELRKTRQRSGKKPEEPMLDSLSRNAEQLARRIELMVDPVAKIPELPDGAVVRVNLTVWGDVVAGALRHQFVQS